jgi:transposase
VVVLDNFGAHKKGERVQKPIKERGCELTFLAPYSPYPNPLKEAFSKVKGLLGRARRVRSREALSRLWAGCWMR